METNRLELSLPGGEGLGPFIHQLPSVIIWELLLRGINSLILQRHSSARGQKVLEPWARMHSKNIHVLAVEILAHMY